MPVPREVLELIERFDRNRDAYRSGQYNETQLYHEFVGPFANALGRDVNNEQDYTEAYKDVAHKVAISTSGEDEPRRVCDPAPGRCDGQTDRPTDVRAVRPDRGGYQDRRGGNLISENSEVASLSLPLQNKHTELRECVSSMMSCLPICQLGVL